MAASIDDGGSFDRLLREVEEAANGDEELRISLLTKRIVEGFVNAHVEAFRRIKKNGSVNFDKLGFYVPRRTRKSLTNIQEECVERKKILKRGFDENHDSNDEEQVVRKPLKLMKMSKKVISLPQPQTVLDLDPHPKMPQAFLDCIHQMRGTDIVLVMQKEITESDLNKQLNRLSIPRNKIRAEFLTVEEHNRLDAKQGISVLLLQPSMEITTLKLKKWVMNSTYCYNLIGAWYKDVVKNDANQLVKDCMVQLWSFRRCEQLCFSLVKL